MINTLKILDFKPLLWVVALTVSFRFGNDLLLSTNYFLPQYTKYLFSLNYIYTTFSLFSIAILTVLFIIHKRNKDIVGFTYLLLTSIKMGICGYLFSEIIHSSNKNKIERINFFLIFILFLAIETLITIQLLNKKQQTTQ